MKIENKSLHPSRKLLFHAFKLIFGQTLERKTEECVEIDYYWEILSN